MQSLETRIAFLESLLQQYCPDVATDHLVDDTIHPVHAQPDQQQSVSATEHEDDDDEREHTNYSTEGGTHPRLGSAETPEHFDELSTEVALLCLSAAGREPHYFGPSSAVSFSKIVSTIMGLPRRQGTSVASESPRATRQPFRDSSPRRFPSRGLARSLSQAYFTNIHPQYPFLHRPTFHRWEETCIEASCNDSMGECGDIELFFVLMVGQCLCWPETMIDAVPVRTMTSHTNVDGDAGIRDRLAGNGPRAI